MNTNFIWHLVEPSHLLVYGLMLGLIGWRWAWGKRCLWVTALALIACSILPIGQVLIRPLEQRFPMPEALGKVDGVIVLAGAEMAELTEYYTEPQLNQHADRLTSFMMLAHDFPSARLVHSGGGTGSYNQSDTARAILIGSGIAADRITFEARSRNTIEGARFTREQVAPRPGERWLLVTSAFHLPRAVASFCAAQWPIVPYPADYKTLDLTPYFSLVENLSLLDLAVHEWLGLAYYRLTGATEILYPDTTAPCVFPPHSTTR